MAVIDNLELLWRRLHPTFLVSKEGGEVRISSGAFKTAELSVDRSSILIAMGLDHRFTAQEAPGVAEVAAAKFRSLDLEPEPDPLPDNPAHAVVRTTIDKKTAKQLADASVFRAN